MDDYAGRRSLGAVKIRGAVLREMEAARPFARTQPMTIEDLELDDPGPGEVLIRMEAAGVCHSDLSVVDGNRPRPLPMLLGHEGAGIVEEPAKASPTSRSASRS